MEHIHFETISSTQDFLLDAHKNGEAIDIVTAKQQISGRGRNDNTWDSYHNSLAFSFKLSPSAVLTLTPLEVGILILDFLNIDSLKLKWPNDILLTDKSKCGGIIVQLIDDIAFVGIGINYGLSGRHKEYRTKKSEIFQRDLLLAEYELIPKEIYTYILNNRIENSEKIISHWNNKCIHLDHNVTIIDQDFAITGIFKGIGPHGEALILAEDEIKKIYNGSLIIN